MNPETQYPELKTMTDQMVFIERACIWRNGKPIKLADIQKVILKSQKTIFVRQLKELFGGEEIYLTTIER